MTLNTDQCRFLEWDSEFFGCRIAALTGEILTPDNLESVLSWCAANRIDCLYFLANIEDHQTVALAEKHGFHFTDIRVTLEAKLTALQQARIDGESIIRSAAQEDIKQLREIASVNHTDSRFYYDGKFPREKCDELFAVWIEESCRGFADIVLVAKRENVIDGYITCSVDTQDNGNIGLVGVSPNSQGKGVGGILVNAAINWFRSKNISDVTVVTQGRNVKAQRLYQRNGFVTKSVKNWYHLWFT